MKSPASAMILAAGLGMRMRPLTNQTPKPLVRVAGRPLIAYNIEALTKFNAERIVINIHHLPEKMLNFVNEIQSASVFVSYEKEGLLDSGGGIKRALPLLGSAPFFILNGDSFFTDLVESNLNRMANYWNPDKMDVLLLLADRRQSTGYDGQGDFDLDKFGTIKRSIKKSEDTSIYTGTAILKPELFYEFGQETFSLNILFDRAIQRQRIFGLKLMGNWFHVGTIASLKLVEERIKENLISVESS
jgi:N-acetyl-alpha-D-muramate 1-phosphate uridylyltransferase